MGKDREIVTSDEIASEFERKLRERKKCMQAVRNAALELTNAHPDQFSVIPITNEHMQQILAETEFDVEFEDRPETLRLTLDVTAWDSGDLENCINIRPAEGKWMDDDAVSYRLDISQGRDVIDEYERLKAKISIAPESTSDEWFQETMRGVIAGMYDIGDNGMVSEMTDNYAETTIKTDTAKQILINAKNLRRPIDGYGRVRGVTFTQFREYIDQNEGRQLIYPQKMLGF
ncbi:hypothetical protein JXA63_03980 [Candidatus Woesebacteria bacterium]|nr:hypothetical protein [Candidatus Woesebacteria bacterium]